MKKVLIKNCPKYPEMEGRQGIVINEKQSRFNTKLGYRDMTVYAVEVDGKRIPGWATDEDISFINN